MCIPVYGAHDLFVACLRSVLAHTPESVPILVCDDASPDPRSREFVAGLASDHQLFYARRERNVGFPANANGGFAAAAPADVVILNSDCVVAAGWLEGLRHAAYSDTAIATATALANEGSVVSVPEAGALLSQADPEAFGAAAAAVRTRSLRLRPRLITAVGHCVYVRRDALELVGEFDLAFSPGYGEEVDFSQRCLHAGLEHVAADEVLVLHHGGASLGAGGESNPVQHQHELMIAGRYPYYHNAVHALQADRAAPLARSLTVARRALKGLTLAVDVRGSALGDGDERDAVALVSALAATGTAAHMKVIVSPQARDHWNLEGVEVMSLAPSARSKPGPRADVIHRVHPVQSPAELGALSRLGDRLIVTYDDLSAYRNPSRFVSFRAWERYRSVTRRALATADRAVFCSDRARDAALAEQLVEPGRASVIYAGVESGAGVVPAPPAGGASLSPDVPVLLCLASEHRAFVLRVLEALETDQDWAGKLVLAGAPADHARPSGVIDLGEISDAERAWLLDRADLVLHPTPEAAAGRLVFAAAERGTAALWAPGTWLSEVLPDAAALIVPWDATATATRALELLRDDGARRHHVEIVRSAAQKLRWESAARQLIDVYNLTCDSAPAPAGAPERGERLMHEHLSEDAIRLVGPDGLLPREFERPLLALASHPQIGDPVFRAIKAGYRVSNRLRRLAGRADDTNGALGPNR